MIVKVCGLIDPANIDAICQLPIDMIGINFYKPSPRYIGRGNAAAFANVPPHIKKVGVFVKEDLASLAEIVDEYSLDYIQLHGDESVDYGLEAKRLAPVIKVSRIREESDVHSLTDHEYASMFLLDTYHAAYGGSGEKFSWKILDLYEQDKPILLSGGIGPKDTESIHKVNHPHFIGVDINSKFEVEAGIKNVDAVSLFAHTLKMVDG